MREIKFRGKTLEDRGMLPAGSWIEGGYYVDYCYGGCPEGKHYIVTWNSTGLGFADLIQVDPETVGEYTGLKDKNGKEIYEGDIVLHAGRLLRYIEYDRGAFVLVRKEDTNVYQLYTRLSPIRDHVAENRFEVIGNIHEHPHLLKGEDKA